MTNARSSRSYYCCVACARRTERPVDFSLSGQLDRESHDSSDGLADDTDEDEIDVLGDESPGSIKSAQQQLRRRSPTTPGGGGSGGGLSSKDQSSAAAVHLNHPRPLQPHQHSLHHHHHHHHQQQQHHHLNHHQQQQQQQQQHNLHQQVIGLAHLQRLHR
uniref:Uncharacterized protein n=1 Tax=Trichogramma kaykai TaxID=54128 RepID=A0ABD2VSR2_9HYME